MGGLKKEGGLVCLKKKDVVGWPKKEGEWWLKKGWVLLLKKRGGVAEERG